MKPAENPTVQTARPATLMHDGQVTLPASCREAAQWHKPAFWVISCPQETAGPLKAGNPQETSTVGPTGPS